MIISTTGKLLRNDLRLKWPVDLGQPNLRWCSYLQHLPLHERLCLMLQPIPLLRAAQVASLPVLFFSRCSSIASHASSGVPAVAPMGRTSPFRETTSASRALCALLHRSRLPVLRISSVTFVLPWPEVHSSSMSLTASVYNGRGSSIASSILYLEHHSL